MTKTFVVNLKKDTSRFEKFKHKDIIRWNATTIDDIINDEIVDKMISYWNVRYTKFHYCKCACTVSHLKLWKHIIKHKIDDVLILEDDAVGNWDYDTSYFMDDGITYLGGVIYHRNNIEKKWKENFYEGYHILDDREYRLLQTMAYYIPTWTLLKQLYDKIINLERYKSIDIMISNTDIGKYFVYPAIFTEEKVESTINPSKKKHSNQLYQLE
jgi:GR25 family glycosyltransferase involved in LPS biosynthesis